jgi:HEPN domain-containing protein
MQRNDDALRTRIAHIARMSAFALTTDAALDALTHALITRVKPERIVLFGSRARGDHHEGSDYDIIVVLDTPLGDSERTRFVQFAIGPQPIHTEIFVYTPQEFLRKRNDVGTMVYAAEHEGRVLYARPGSTLDQRVGMVRESPAGPPESFNAWMARVENDLQTMELALAAEPLLIDGVCFHAHAAAEKLLKAALVFTHTPPPRTHTLPDILAICPPALRDDTELQRACVVLEASWPKSRYPEQGMPAIEDAYACARAARSVRDAMRAAGFIA